jgi:hypothetical protein
VLLIPTTHVEDWDDQEPAGEPPVTIAEDIALERLSNDESELVMNACMPRGHYFIAVRQYGQRYCFVRSVESGSLDDSRYGWDVDHTLFYAVVLSRLVRDNGHSLEFAARIVDYDDGMQQVIPVIAPAHVATFRLRKDRDWLTAEEAAELAHLLSQFLPLRDDLPWPVVHALNLAEDAVHLQIIQRALLLIATGLEGLIQSDRHDVSRQFRERLPRLAAEVGVDGVDAEFAGELYRARSEAAHGAPVSMFQVVHEPVGDEEVLDEPDFPQGEPAPPEAELEPAEKIALAQYVLRNAVRKAIEDGDFREVFRSRDAIAAHWPV